MSDETRARALLVLGAVLFLLGLLTGLFVSFLRVPRLGLSAHLEGLMNGTFLLVLGAIWHRVHLPRRLSGLCFGLLVYGAFANWCFTLLGAALGGSRMMPLAGGASSAGPWEEALVGGGLVTLTLAMIGGCSLLVWGLFRRADVAQVGGAGMPAREG